MCWAGFDTPLPADFGAAAPVFLTGARGVDGFLGMVPFIDGLWTCVAIVKVLTTGNGKG